MYFGQKISTGASCTFLSRSISRLNLKGFYRKLNEIVQIGNTESIPSDLGDRAMKFYFQVCRKKLRRTVASLIRMNQFRTGREAGIGSPFQMEISSQIQIGQFEIFAGETKSLVELAKHSPIMSEVTNAPKSTAVKTREQISEISKENLFADEKEKFTKVFEIFCS